MTHPGMKLLLSVILSAMVSLAAGARDSNVVRGFGGGMMLHTGFLKGGISQPAYQASGMPFGIGGVIKVHLGEHWRVGGEGYVSTLKQLNNGSYVKYGWGGVLGDFYWRFGRFIPYAGVTVGGGANTNLLITGESVPDWEPVKDTYFSRQGFMAIAPFLGCEYVVSEAFHLTLKADWLNCLGSKGRLPEGPRLYFGFIFSH